MEPSSLLLVLHRANTKPLEISEPGPAELCRATLVSASVEAKSTVSKAQFLGGRDINRGWSSRPTAHPPSPGLVTAAEAGTRLISTANFAEVL